MLDGGLLKLSCSSSSALLTTVVVAEILGLKKLARAARFDFEFVVF